MKRKLTITKSINFVVDSTLVLPLISQMLRIRIILYIFSYVDTIFKFLSRLVIFTQFSTLKLLAVLFCSIIYIIHTIFPCYDFPFQIASTYFGVLVEKLFENDDDNNYIWRNHRHTTDDVMEKKRCNKIFCALFFPLWQYRTFVHNWREFIVSAFASITALRVSFILKSKFRLINSVCRIKYNFIITLFSYVNLWMFCPAAILYGMCYWHV